MTQTHVIASKFENASAAKSHIVSFELSWWAVGQGLFASGRLSSSRGGEFTWVYDCGSNSGSVIRDNAIARYSARYSHINRIDLVALSHFDIDHINGIVALIQTKPIGTLLLPYIPLWQRLLIAIGEGVTLGSAMFDFFIDPASYLSGIEGGDIGEIVFVPSAGPDDSVPDAPEKAAPIFPIEGAKIDFGEADDDVLYDEVMPTNNLVRVRYLRRKGCIIVSSFWEFVPYNDAQMQPKGTASFQRRANFVAKIFVTRPRCRPMALDLLKKLYARTFGAGSRPQNLISLFLYSGPIGTLGRLSHTVSSVQMRLNANRDNFSQLYTGDGYLETPTRIGALQGFYVNDRRFERAGIIQVMHHGARRNWHDSVAAILKPAVSVFCSDPAHHHGHPHAEVLRDFWPWCPVQVDVERVLHILGLLSFP